MADTQKVWFRIGGYLSLTEEEISSIREGTSFDIMQVLQRGVELDGETYAYDEEVGLTDQNELYLRGGITLFPGNPASGK